MNIAIMNCNGCHIMTSCVQIAGRSKSTGRIVNQWLCRDFCLKVWENEHIKQTHFDPHEDTCEGCGGQKTPAWPGYPVGGPENGNCAGETDEC